MRVISESTEKICNNNREILNVHSRRLTADSLSESKLFKIFKCKRKSLKKCWDWLSFYCKIYLRDYSRVGIIHSTEKSQWLLGYDEKIGDITMKYLIDSLEIVILWRNLKDTVIDVCCYSPCSITFMAYYDVSQSNNHWDFTYRVRKWQLPDSFRWLHYDISW